MAARRCKAGKRAIIISGPNAGKIVFVIKAVDYDKNWPRAVVGWLVESEGSALDIFQPKADGWVWKGKRAVARIDDRYMSPLDDEEPAPARSRRQKKVVS